MVKVKNKLIVALITLLAVILASTMFVIKNQTNTESNSLKTKVSADTIFTEDSKSGLYQADGTFVDASDYLTKSGTSLAVNSTYTSAAGEVYLNSYNMTGITDLRDMFSNCSGLTNITFGSDFDTSSVKLMNLMFSGCNGLTSIIFGSNFNTSNVIDMSSMFYDCSSLTSLDVSNFNTTKVTNISYMFKGCSGLTSLNLSNFDTTNVTNMAGMFAGCKVLKSLDLSNFDTSKVTSMSSMFSSCSALTSITFGSNYNTSKVTSMGYMFIGCKVLKSLDLSNFDTSNVTNMTEMFSGCIGLKSLDLNNFDLSKVKSYYSMFNNCSSLTKIVGPKDIGSLTNKISLPSQDASGNTQTWSVSGNQVSKYLQAGVTMLRSDYVVPATLPSDWQSKVGVSGITSIKFGTTSEVSDYTDSNKTIDSDIKVYVKNTTDIALVNDAGIVAPSDCSDLFSISSLKTIDLTNLDMSSVTSTNNMLAGCDNLTSITAPSKLASGQSIILPTSSNKTWKNASGENITSLTTGTVTAETISTPDVPSTGVVSTSASILATVLVVAMLGYAISKKRKKA